MAILGVAAVLILAQPAMASGNFSAHAGEPMIRIDFLKVKTPFVIVIWLLVANFLKMAFHEIPTKVQKHIPESFMLLVSGILLGFSLIYTEFIEVGPLSPHAFFVFLLPPIVLDAGYHMPNRLFFDNLLTILAFAVVGTIFNAFLVGGSLHLVARVTGWFHLPLLHGLLFGSIAAAVDPVAVLAVFEDIHVNEMLYILVFGESLLNDAVTVVLYQLFENFSALGLANIQWLDLLKGVGVFLYVAAGGVAVGVTWGFLSAFLTSLSRRVRVMEPLMVYCLAYLAYLIADMLNLSGILALTFCGITMKNYVEENISYKSHITIKVSMKMISSVSESAIFIFLGMAIFNDESSWNFTFIAFTIIFCSLYRCVGVVLLSALVNRFRLRQINRIDQFILSYGGLRGAVSFALALVIDGHVVPGKSMMVSAIIALVFFTVMVQGLSIGTLVRWLKVPLSESCKPSMNQRIHGRVIDHIMAGVEDIVGSKMGNHHLRDKFKYYNNKYIRPHLTRNPAVFADPKIFETYSKLNLADALMLARSHGKLTPTMQANGFSTLFRAYTQSAADMTRQYEPPFPDLGELQYTQSSRDLADAQYHHILLDAMARPHKKHHHHHHHHHCHQKNPTDQGSTLKPPPHIKVNDSALSDSPTRQNKVNIERSQRELSPEDDGIVFVARPQQEDAAEGEEVRTLAESTLPWLRPESGETVGCQREFPSWMDENQHRSPSSTVLERLDRSSRPALADIFPRDGRDNRAYSHDDAPVVVHMEPGDVQLTKL